MSLPIQVRLLHLVAPSWAKRRNGPVPVPSPGEVLARICAVATCPHWDLPIFEGRPMFPGGPLDYPYLSSEIAAFGPEVTSMAPPLLQGQKKAAPLPERLSFKT